MSLDTRTIRAHRVPQKQAAAHAATRLHLGVYTETPGMVHWRGANLGRPQTVYDLNNQPLFYDFPVRSRLREQLGLIRTSASRVIGVPAVSTYLGETPWDVRGATAKAVDAVRKRFRGEILRTRLVCYAYPKLGIAVYWKKEGRTERTIIDIGDLSMVPEKVEPGLRGPGAWSYYGRMKKDDVPDAVKRFRTYEKLVEEVQERSRLDLSKTLRRYEFEAVQAQVAKLLKLYTTKILTFCTHGFSHECFRLHPQENGYYCVVATGQMLLDFWRYHHTQNQIANNMGTTPGGTSYAGEVNGYEALTCSHFDAEHDTTPTFAEARAEIDANRPFDYSYSYHAMACAGYKRRNIFILGQEPENSLLIYDPSPVNQGTIFWEVWGEGRSPVDGFVYLRRP